MIPPSLLCCPFYLDLPVLSWDSTMISTHRQGRWSALLFRWTLGVGILCAALTGLAVLAGYTLPGGTLAFSSTRPRYFPNIYLLDINRGWLWPLTKGDASRSFPEWSRDGQEVLFTACDLTDCE